MNAYPEHIVKSNSHTVAMPVLPKVTIYILSQSPRICTVSSSKTFFSLRFRLPVYVPLRLQGPLGLGVGFGLGPGPGLGFGVGPGSPPHAYFVGILIMNKHEFILS